MRRYADRAQEGQKRAFGIAVVGALLLVVYGGASFYDTHRTNAWTPTGAMHDARESYAAVLLKDGRVLVAGGYVLGRKGTTVTDSIELYDPRTGAWTRTVRLHAARQGHTATLLRDGRVLVVGGVGRDDRELASAELYDPRSGAWRLTGRLHTARAFHTATLLQDGRVLVAGGTNSNITDPLRNAETYNPCTNAWTLMHHMAFGRRNHTATLLTSGLVLVVGGHDQTNNTSRIAEIYDPRTDTWTHTASMADPRQDFTATRLNDGRVLVAGGRYSHILDDSGGTLNSAEIYDPRRRSWSRAAPMSDPRSFHTATLLADGRVLVTGGDDGSRINASAEVYNSHTNTWTHLDDMTSARADHTATLLMDGRVLVAGGSSDWYSTQASVEITSRTTIGR